MNGPNGIIPGAHPRPAGGEKTRRRLRMVAAVNGWSVAVLGGLCFLLSLMWFSLWGVLVGAAATASGCMELTGRRRVKQGCAEAGRWLAGSQLLLLGAIFLYAGCSMLWFNPHAFLAGLNPAIRQQLASAMQALASSMTERDLEEMISRLVQVFYAVVMLATLLYQGGLCLYYTRATRRVLLEEALTAESVAHSPITSGGTETPKRDRAP